MASQPQSLWLHIEPIGDVTVVRFRLQEIVKDRTIESIGDTLDELVQHGQRQLLLDFAQVQGMASLMLGKLIGVARRADDVGGRVVVCNVQPDLSTLFESLKLSQLFSVYGDEQAALESFTA
jgi:anti-anti-sigma factor